MFSTEFAAKAEIVVLLIHLETLLFVVAATVLQYSGWSLVTDQSACDAATIVCLVGYATNKVFYNIINGGI